MVDRCSETWWTLLNIFYRLAEVNLAKLVSHEEHVPEAINGGRFDRHLHSLECRADFDVPGLPGEPSLVLDPAYFVLGPILHRWQLIRKGPRTDLVPTGWNCHPQGLVGPFQVVDFAPAVESFLTMPKVLKNGSSQHFKGQDSMKALVFSLSLGMVKPAVADTYAQSKQPYG